MMPQQSTAVRLKIREMRMENFHLIYGPQMLGIWFVQALSLNIGNNNLFVRTALSSHDPLLRPSLEP